MVWAPLGFPRIKTIAARPSMLFARERAEKVFAERVEKVFAPWPHSPPATRLRPWWPRATVAQNSDVRSVRGPRAT